MRKITIKKLSKNQFSSFVEFLDLNFEPDRDHDYDIAAVVLHEWYYSKFNKKAIEVREKNTVKMPLSVGYAFLLYTSDIQLTDNYFSNLIHMIRSEIHKQITNPIFSK